MLIIIEEYMRKWELIVNLIFLFGFPFVIILITIPLLIIGPSPQRYLWLSIPIFVSGIILLIFLKRVRLRNKQVHEMSSINILNLNKISLLSH